MKKRAGFVVAGFVALMVCSCASRVELERARAEAEAARAEAERARAEAEAERMAAIAARNDAVQAQAEAVKQRQLAEAQAEDLRDLAERSRALDAEMRAKANALEKTNVEATKVKEAEEKAKTEAAKQKEAQEKAMAEVMKRWNAAAGGVMVAGPLGAPVDFVWKDTDKFPHPTYKGGSAEAYGAFAGGLLAFLQNDDNFDYLAKNKLFTAELRYTFPNGQASKWTFAGLIEQLSAANALGNHDDATRKSLKALADKIKTPPKG